MTKTTKKRLLAAPQRGAANGAPRMLKRVLSFILTGILAVSTIGQNVAFAANTYAITDAMSGTIAGQLDGENVYQFEIDAAYDSFAISPSPTGTYDSAYLGTSTTGTTCVTPYVEKIERNSTNFEDAKSAFAENQASLDFITQSPDADYALFHLYKNGPPFLGGGSKGYLVVEWIRPQNVDKTALEQAIQSAPNQDSDLYYCEGDRYNGNSIYTISSKVGSFWSDYQETLAESTKIYGNTYATQDAVDQAVKDLQEAIGKLISKQYVNATELYECLNSYEKTETGYLSPAKVPLDEANYTAARWEVFVGALTEAEDLLDALYDADGTPTERNWGPNRTGDKPENAITNDTLTEAIAAIQKAESGLVKNEVLAETDTRREEIAKLNELFPLADADASQYTEESWEAFTAARTEAEELLRTYPTQTDIPNQDTAQRFTNVRDSYHAACYGLTPVADSFTVQVTVNDCLGAAYPQYALTDSATAVFSGTKTLKSGDSLAELEKLFDWSADMAGAAEQKITPYYIVYLNGLQVNGVNVANYVFTDDVKLRPNDRVTILRVVAPVGDYYGWDSTPESEELEPYLEVLRFTTDPATLHPTEGESFSLDLVAAAGSFTGYTGQEHASTGKEIIAYRDGEGVPVQTGFFTDRSGRAEVTLYQAGTYTLIAVDTSAMVKGSEYPNLGGGASIRVTVGQAASEALEAMRQEYLAAAQALLADYGQDKLAGLYGQAQTAYDTAAATMASATSMQQIKDAGDTLEATLADLQAQAESGFSLEDFRDILQVFPSAEELARQPYYDSMADLALALKRTYAAATDYQKSQLTTAEAAQYEAIQKCYGEDGSGLPKAEPATVTIVLDGPEAAKDAFETFNVLTGGRPEGSTSTRGWTETGYGWGSTISEGYTNDNLKTDIIPGRQYVSLYVRVAAEFQDRYQITGCLLNGQALGEDDGVDLDDSSCYIRFNITLWGLRSGENTITVQVSEKDETAVAIAAIRQELTDAYAGYRKALYSSEQWVELTGYYQAGLSAINGAKDEEAARAALNTALSNMAGVPTLAQQEQQDETVGPYGSVHVVIENTTYPEGAFTGTIAEGDMPLNENSTMMTAALQLLQNAGFSWTGTGGSKGNKDDDTITYLSSISKDSKTLGEFSGSAQSGWMGTLNDWFVNEGFQSFSVSAADRNYRLADGDEVRIMFTDDLGVDLGGGWGDPDTSLASLTVSGGELTPTFSGGVLTYTLMPASGPISVRPTAINKNYQVRTYLNETSGDNWYRPGETIPARVGDTIYIGVGERSWPSMNNQGTDAVSYTGTWYSIRVLDRGSAGGVIELIDAIPSIRYTNYNSQVDAVNLARAAYEALTAEAKTQVTNLEKLESAEAQIQKFQEIDDVKALLAEIPAADRLTTADRSRVQAARDAYDKLDEDQKLYITVADVTKYNAAVEWLESQGITISGGSISGSEKPPEELETVETVTLEPTAQVDSDGNASVTVSAADLNTLVEDAKKGEATQILIAPTGAEEASAIAVELAGRSLTGVVSDTDAELAIRTHLGEVTIPNDTLDSILGEAGGQDLTIELSAGTAEQAQALLAEERAVTAQLLEQASVTQVRVTSGGTAVTSFGGRSLTLRLPVDEARYRAGDVCDVYQVSDDGTVEKLTGTCRARNGRLWVEVVITHLSTFIVMPPDESARLPFTDVDEEDWFYDAVAYVYRNGLFDGTSATTFSPETLMTRAMLVTILYRMEGEPAITAENPFTDVPADTWYTDAVIWADANSIVNGVGNERFAPADNITREQMAVMLYRYAQYKGYDLETGADLSQYTDADGVSAWALDAVRWANGEELLTGRTATTIAPEGMASRAEGATILTRFLERVAADK